LQVISGVQVTQEKLPAFASGTQRNVPASSLLVLKWHQ
jgi:hypothetical protein